MDISAANPRRDVAELSIAVVAGLGLAFTLLFLFAVPFAGHIAGSRDFISYWATGKQLVRHANPYDREAIAAIEHAAGLDARATLIMRNPPWALPLAWPLGFLNLRLATVLWSLLLLICLFVSVWIVRSLHGSPPNHIHWLGLAFTPALLCISMGQTSLLALLGVTLFLRWQAKRPFAAGLSLWLCALKPHLFLPFGAALLAWIVMRRRWKIVAGTVTAVGVTTIVGFLLDPRAWADYSRMMRSPLVENEFIPCLSDAIRQLLVPQAVWMQYLPSALAALWAVIYFWQRRLEWDWARNGSLLLLVSLFAAPYCWLYDQCLAIPALIHAGYVTRSRALITAFALLIFAADAELCFIRVFSPWWLWTAPAWLAWYLFASAVRPANVSLERDCQPDVSCSPSPSI